MKPAIVLASASPRRQELLERLGLRFRVHPADIDESPHAHETAPQLVERLSKAKAAAVAVHYPQALVIAADTVVVSQGDILTKPRDSQENRRYLERLAGTGHQVYTGHSLHYQGRQQTQVRCSQVYFRALRPEEIAWYLATGEGLDKAGGYAIQGRGAALVEKLEGCYFNVMGMSVAAVMDMSLALGVSLV